MKKFDHLVHSDAESKQNQAQSDVDRNYRWRIDTGNSETFLRHISVSPGTNSSMFYIGGTITHFSFHIEDENLFSKSVSCAGDTKNLCLINSTPQQILKDFVAPQILAKKYMNDQYGGARQILAT